jgi:hypothetical protein
MYLFYCDESNLEKRSGDFLLYAGITIPDHNALALSRTIDALLANPKISRDYRLKFNPRPTNLDHQEFIVLKSAVIEAAIKADVKLLSYMILHDIAKSPDEARRNGINHTCFHFDCYLNRVKDTGLVLVDRFNDEGNEIGAHLTEKFSVGLKNMPYSREMRLENIVGFHYSAIGQSHFPSILDVIVGSLRFAINVYTRQPQYKATAMAILKSLNPLFFREEGSEKVSEIGLILSPKAITIKSYRQKYQGLKDFFAEAGIALAQEITEHRTY